MIKRLADLTIAGLALFLLSPVFLVVYILIVIKIGRPAFFTQRRPGLHGKTFYMIKFRTMTLERGADGELLPDGDRMTPLGALLRSTSLDELPELFNVLRGEMSMVGPRPLLIEYLSLYSPEQFRRHEVRPGITGWAQVNGRNNLSWKEKFELDVWYVDNRSFVLDLKILFLTLRKVVAREGVNAEGEVTVSKFMGNDK